MEKAGSGDDVRQTHALEGGDAVLECQLLFLQPLQFHLIGEALPEELGNAGIQRPMGSTQGGQAHFDFLMRRRLVHPGNLCAIP